MICTRKIRPFKVNLYCGDRKLKQCTSFKYLGIIIDNKFLFYQHIDYYKINKARLALDVTHLGVDAIRQTERPISMHAVQTNISEDILSAMNIKNWNIRPFWVIFLF